MCQTLAICADFFVCVWGGGGGGGGGHKNIFYHFPHFIGAGIYDTS